MSILNVEIKAKCPDHKHIRSVLNQHNAKFVGVDNQTDTYFNVNRGRLKLREGNVENALIFYERKDVEGPKKSNIELVKTQPDSEMKLLLSEALGVLIEVKKKREIYFIDNVKFHLDDLTALGKFVEIEAIDEDGSIGEEELDSQCKKYIELFGIKESDLIFNSYSDMLLTDNQAT